MLDNQIISVKEILELEASNQKIEVKGWIRNKRGSKKTSFLSINDGSTIKTLQVIAEDQIINEATLKDITTGCCVQINGILKKSIGANQRSELFAEKIKILGLADPNEYPLQPKKHSLEFLREKAHLRFRTNTFSAVFRIRHCISFAIHKYFNDRGFYYINTPIITSADAEGAGELFQVTNLKNINSSDSNYENDFFGKKTNLTVSGQLEAELAALGLGKVYTFGPTFRAENSNTSRHLAEFWMIEPEVAFYDLKKNAALAEDFLKYCINYCLEHCKNDLLFLEQRLASEESSLKKELRSELSLIEKLVHVSKSSFENLTYTEAISILKNSKPNKKKKFKYLISEFGNELQSEHERFLVEKVFKKPVVITDYPKKIKAFYMRLNDDNKTVRAMDILFPGIGEIIGGSQREERLDVLNKNILDFNIDKQELWWYLETRKFGTCEHSGFGLGLERLVMFITGMKNIRDVIPFPRTPKNVSF